MVSSTTGALDKQSAMRLVSPFIYSTVMSYGMVGRSKHCICGVASTRDLLRIACSGFWSVCSMKGLTYK